VTLAVLALAAGLVALLTRSLGPAYVGLVVGGYGLGLALPRGDSRRTALLRVTGVVSVAALIVLVGIVAQVIAAGHDALGLVFGLCSLAIAVTLIIVHGITAAR
jgi:hypothetical protein